MDSTRTNGSGECTIVIGGGLAGLTAAAFIAKQGRRVTLVEQSRRVGGRAATNVRHEVCFNLGAHALYCHGEAFRVLRELEVPFHGAYPNPGRPRLYDGGAAYALPRNLQSILASGWLSLRDKWRLTRLFASLEKLDTRPLDHVPLTSWIEDTVGEGQAARLLHALFRLTTYGHEPGEMSAGTAIGQFQLSAAGNVWYLDDGWQSLIDGLQDVAMRHDAQVLPSTCATAIRANEDGVEVDLTDGTSLSGAAVVLAAGPQEVLDLVQPSAHPAWRAQLAALRPVRAACLDVALSKLPDPDCRFALGADKPFYFSVHSAAARLAREDVAVVHVMKYLGPENSSAGTETELEQFLEQVQPGWREHLITRRTLPNMTVSHALPLAASGGLAGRPAVDALGEARVYLAGDWVGDRGMLADASVASAEQAAAKVVALLEESDINTRSVEYA